MTGSLSQPLNGMTPYYQEDGMVIIHADCLEVLPQMGPARMDLLLTDPPYGLDLGRSNNPQRRGGYGSHLGKGSYLSYDDSYENFVSLIIPRLNAALDVSHCAAVFTGPHLTEQRKPTAIGGIYSPSASGRTPWGSKNFLPILFYGNPPGAGQHRPTVLKSFAHSECTEHPAAKPVTWCCWLIGLGSPPASDIFDPFMGAGTTLVAAKRLGRRAIGIEIEERYCEIAAKRLCQGILPFEEYLEPHTNGDITQLEIAFD